MAKRKTNSGRGGQNRRLGLGLAIGLLIGLGVAICAALYVNRAALEIDDNHNIVERTIEGEDDDEVDFDFYEVLPKGDDASVARESFPRASNELNGVFFIQVAALSKPKEADNFKARLALNGFESRIEKVELSDGQKIFRVRIGPFATAEELEVTRKRLTEFNFETSVVRVGKSY